MKSTFFTLIAVALLSLAFNAPVSKVSVDTSKSVIVWKGYKVTGAHEGTIRVKAGSLDMQDGMLKGGSFTIDMNSITCTDMTGGGADKLVGHLKSDDFFGVEKYPTATFTITSVVSRGTPGAYKIVGNMKIKDTTKSIRFNANIKEEDGAQVATADITLDRSEYDIRFGSGSFFDSLGDKTIYDEFDLQVKLVLQ
jgi:polyisoprenoid-binding protein YceI